MSSQERHSNDTNDCQQLEMEWQEIQEKKPANPARPPTPTELLELQAHKKRVKDFLVRLPPDTDLRSFPGSKPLKVQARPLHSAKHTPQKPCRPRLVLCAKAGTPVELGWTHQAHVYHYTIPFCSHRTRRPQEEREDAELGIDRRVFSNLFMEPLRIIKENENHAELLGHAAEYREAMCSESFYMAAKARYRCDACFIMNDLKESIDVARYGHSGLRLTNEQKERLIGYGAYPDDFLAAEENEWLRGSDGVFPIRDNWYEHRHNVFLYLLRHKFRIDDEHSTVAGRSMIAMVQRIDSLGAFPLLVEHRKLDRIWGDGRNGDGCNLLGRILTQIVLEFAEQSQPARASFLSLPQVRDCLMRPNKELVDYRLEV